MACLIMGAVGGARRASLLCSIIFTSSSPTDEDMRAVLDAITPSVFAYMNMLLTRTCSKEEVWEALT